MLAFSHLTKRYGSRAVVDDLTLEIAPGAIFGLLGPNGAGKTTTLAMALHLVRPDAGRVAIGGVDVWAEPGRALRAVGALIETAAFYPYLSALDNLRVVANHAGLPTNDLAARLAAVGLGETGRQPVETFSQGMKQRLGLASALLGDPALLLLDEPTTGLDPRGVVELRSLLRTLADQGRTIVFSSHQRGGGGPAWGRRPAAAAGRRPRGDRAGDRAGAGLERRHQSARGRGHDRHPGPGRARRRS
jgi:ABC-2 type transport system ATP-binding protein